MTYNNHGGRGSARDRRRHERLKVNENTEYGARLTFRTANKLFYRPTPVNARNIPPRFKIHHFLSDYSRASR